MWMILLPPLLSNKKVQSEIREIIFYFFLRLFSVFKKKQAKKQNTHPCWFYPRSCRALHKSMKSHGTCRPVPAFLVPPRWRASSSSAKSFGCAYSARAFLIGRSQKSLRACGPLPGLAAKCGWWGRPTLCMCGTCTWTKRMRASHPGRTVRRTTSTTWRDWLISSSRCESESVGASSFPFKSIPLSMCNHSRFVLLQPFRRPSQRLHHIDWGVKFPHAWHVIF